MGDTAHYPLLERIDSPEELRRVPVSRLSGLAGEVRQMLLNSVAAHGGHLGAGLGAVELAIALHYVFQTPNDRLVWDVGHQAYPHKILTGRRERLETIRQLNGLAPFPKRTESAYDCFGVGHSSTSISAALGMLLATEQQGNDRKIVAIIGDGGLTAGLAYEALNHAGGMDSDLLIVLNDNEMSISPSVGAMHNYLTRLISSPLSWSTRELSKRLLKYAPPLYEMAKRAEAQIKKLVLPGTLFEELGFTYFGPVDGHDLDSLVPTLRNLRNIHGPRLLHVVTRKGKGYGPAESNPVAYHGVGPFDPRVGLTRSKQASAKSYTQVFSEWVCDMAAADQRLVAITPAMREGSGLVEFQSRFPQRYFDVGIAEQHSVTLAAGLACEGHKPVVAIYSTFLQRAYDQLIHDVALQNLPVLFAIDRAGLVGPDGPTHAGSFDLTYMRCLPNLVLMAPADENECRQMLYTGFQLDRPAAVRYPRGCGPGVEVAEKMEALPVGQAELRRHVSDIAILAFGAMVQPAVEAAEQLDATVVNMRFIKPLDESLVLELAGSHQLLVTVEDNVVAGGAGTAVSECLSRHNVAQPVIHIGLPDRFIDHGGRDELLGLAGLDSSGIIAQIQKIRPPEHGRVASGNQPADHNVTVLRLHATASVAKLGH